MKYDKEFYLIKFLYIYFFGISTSIYEKKNKKLKEKYKIWSPNDCNNTLNNDKLTQLGRNRDKLIETDR